MEKRGHRFKDLTGKVIGTTTVLRFAGMLGKGKEPTNDGRSAWFCRCECGAEFIAWASSLKQGTTQGCGCKKNRRIKELRYKHGRYLDPIYKIWRKIKARCGCPTHHAWASYGGRGISLCDRWSDFMKFAEDMGPRPSLKHSVDRKDNDQGYSPENCRWATRAQQANNTRRNRLITAFGKTMTVAEWAQETGISYQAIYLRFRRRKWSGEDSVSPRGPKNKMAYGQKKEKDEK